MRMSAELCNAGAQAMLWPIPAAEQAHANDAARQPTMTNPKTETVAPRLALSIRADDLESLMSRIHGQEDFRCEDDRLFLVLGLDGSTTRVLYAGSEEQAAEEARRAGDASAVDAIQAAYRHDHKSDTALLNGARLTLSPAPPKSAIPWEHDTLTGASDGTALLEFSTWREAYAALDVEVIRRALASGSRITIETTTNGLKARLIAAGVLGQTEVPECVVQLDALWHRVRASIQDLRTHIDGEMAGINARLAAFGAGSDPLGAPELDTTPLLDRARRTLSAAVVAEATRAFIPEGAAICIDTSEGGFEALANGITHGAYQPSHLWRYLAAEYGGGVGATRAWAAAAERLRNVLHPRWGKEPTATRARGVAITLHATASDRSTRGLIDYGYNGASWAEAFVQHGLLPFFAHEEGEGAPPAPEWLWWDYLADLRRANFTSREKRVIGDVTLTHYKSKIEALMPTEMFGRINTFIARYAPLDRVDGGA